MMENDTNRLARLLDSIDELSLPLIDVNDLSDRETLVQPSHFFMIPGISLDNDLVGFQAEIHTEEEEILKLLIIDIERIINQVMSYINQNTDQMNDDQFEIYQARVKAMLTTILSAIAQECSLIDVDNLEILYAEVPLELKRQISLIESKLNVFSRLLTALRTTIIQVLPEEFDAAMEQIQGQYDLVDEQLSRLN